MACNQASSKTESASTIVTQFSQEKLPLTTRYSCVAIITAAAIPAMGCGAKRPNGATS